MEDPPGMAKPVKTEKVLLPPTQKRRLRRPLAECADQCRVVMRFSGECAALAVDQEPGSTIYGWAEGYNNAGVRDRAIDECRRRGGKSCLVRVWVCTRR